jgi:MFS family permease
MSDLAAADPSPTYDHARAKRNVAVLVAAQAILGSQITIIFVIGGLAGQQMAPNVCLATLPLSLIVFGSMTTAPWLSAFMQRFGRRAGFFVGAIGGLIGAAISAYALTIDNFWLFSAGSYLTGVYMSAQGFYRFAAADTASDEFRPKAISYVLAGGLVSAIIGPQVVGLMTDGNPDATVTRFLAPYLVAMAFNVVGMLLFLLLDIPRVPQTAETRAAGRTRRQLLADPRILTAVLVGAVSYALMNLVMTSTPLAVVGCGFGVPDASNVVSAHVLAMFAPSFFTGHLINRFGVERIMGLGLAILAGAGLVALQGVALTNFYVALILLGLGWNFGFIGATTLLTMAHTPAERGRMQGLNDLIVFGGVTLASLASGGLMNCAGGNAEQGWTAVNLAMIPLLALAGGALIWMVLRPRDDAALG